MKALLQSTSSIPVTFIALLSSFHHHHFIESALVNIVKDISPMYFSILVLHYFRTLFNMVSHFLLSSFGFCDSTLSWFFSLTLTAFFQIFLLSHLLFDVRTHLDLILFSIICPLSEYSHFYGFKTLSHGYLSSNTDLFLDFNLKFSIYIWHLYFNIS